MVTYDERVVELIKGGISPESAHTIAQMEIATGKEWIPPPPAPAPIVAAPAPAPAEGAGPILITPTPTAPTSEQVEAAYTVAEQKAQEVTTAEQRLQDIMEWKPSTGAASLKTWLADVSHGFTGYSEETNVLYRRKYEEYQKFHAQKYLPAYVAYREKAHAAEELYRASLIAGPTEGRAVAPTFPTFVPATTPTYEQAFAATMAAEEAGKRIEFLGPELKELRIAAGVSFTPEARERYGEFVKETYLPALGRYLSVYPVAMGMHRAWERAQPWTAATPPEVTALFEKWLETATPTELAFMEMPSHPFEWSMYLETEAAKYPEAQRAEILRLGELRVGGPFAGEHVAPQVESMLNLPYQMEKASAQINRYLVEGGTFAYQIEKKVPIIGGFAGGFVKVFEQPFGWKWGEYLGHRPQPIEFGPGYAITPIGWEGQPPIAGPPGEAMLGQLAASYMLFRGISGAIKLGPKAVVKPYTWAIERGVRYVEAHELAPEGSILFPQYLRLEWEYLKGTGMAFKEAVKSLFIGEKVTEYMPPEGWVTYQRGGLFAPVTEPLTLALARPEYALTWERGQIPFGLPAVEPIPGEILKPGYELVHIEAPYPAERFAMTLGKEGRFALSTYYPYTPSEGVIMVRSADISRFWASAELQTSYLLKPFTTPIRVTEKVGRELIARTVVPEAELVAYRYTLRQYTLGGTEELGGFAWLRAEEMPMEGPRIGGWIKPQAGFGFKTTTLSQYYQRLTGGFAPAAIEAVEPTILGEIAPYYTPTHFYFPVTPTIAKIPTSFFAVGGMAALLARPAEAIAAPPTVAPIRLAQIQPPIQIQPPATIQQIAQVQLLGLTQVPAITPVQMPFLGTAQVQEQAQVQVQALAQVQALQLAQPVPQPIPTPTPPTTVHIPFWLPKFEREKQIVGKISLGKKQAWRYKELKHPLGDIMELVYGKPRRGEKGRRKRK